MDNSGGKTIALGSRHCTPCEGGTQPLSEEEGRKMLETLAGWDYAEGKIAKEFRFKNYHQTMAFVNAVAWVAHRENHHPEMQVGYNTCRITYITHAIGGLSENDFICAARVEKLLAD